MWGSVVTGKFGYPARDPREITSFVASHEAYCHAAPHKKEWRKTMGTDNQPLHSFDHLIGSLAKVKKLAQSFDTSLVKKRQSVVSALQLSGIALPEAIRLAGASVREREFVETLTLQNDTLEAEVVELTRQLQASADENKRKSQLWSGNSQVKAEIAAKEEDIKEMESIMVKLEWAGRKRHEVVVNDLRKQNAKMVKARADVRYLVERKAELQQLLANQSAHMSALGAWLKKDRILLDEVSRVSTLLDTTEREEQASKLDFNRRTDTLLAPQIFDAVFAMTGRAQSRLVTDPFWAAGSLGDDLRCADMIEALRPDNGNDDNDSKFAERAVLISFGDKRALRPKWLPGAATESEAIKYCLRPFKTSFQAKVVAETGVRIVSKVTWPLTDCETEILLLEGTQFSYLWETAKTAAGRETPVSPTTIDILNAEDGKHYNVTFYKCANHPGWVHDFDRKSPGGKKAIVVTDTGRDIPRVIDGNSVFFQGSPVISHIGDSIKMELVRRHFMECLVDNSAEVTLQHTVEDDESGINSKSFKQAFDQHNDLQHRAEDFFGVAADETWLRERDVHEILQRRAEEDTLRHAEDDFAVSAAYGTPGAVSAVYGTEGLGVTKEESPGNELRVIPKSCAHLESHDTWLGGTLKPFENKRRGRYAVYCVRKKSKKARDQKILWMGILLVRQEDCDFVYKEFTEPYHWLDTRWDAPLDYSMAHYVSVEQQRLLADVFMRNDKDRMGIGRAYLTAEQLTTALTAELPNGLHLEWIIGMQEKLKAFDKNQDSIFDYYEFQQMAAHFIIEQTKTMKGAADMLLTQQKRELVRALNRDQLLKMFRRFDLDESRCLDMKEVVAILYELTEGSENPLDKDTIISLFRDYDADGSGDLDEDEFLDLATDLFLLEEHRRNATPSIWGHSAGPSIMVPPPKKDQPKMVLYFGRSEDFPMIDFEMLGKITDDGIIDGMSIIHEDDINGGADFNGLNCEGLSFRLEMARMLFVKCFAKYERINGRVHDNHLFDHRTNKFVHAEHVDFEQVFDASDLNHDDAALDVVGKITIKCDEIRKRRWKAEAAFKEASALAEESNIPATCKLKNDAGAALDRIIAEQDAMNVILARAKDPWVNKFAGLHNFNSDQAAAFRSSVMEAVRRVYPDDESEIDVPHWSDLLVKVLELQEEGPSETGLNGGNWYTVSVPTTVKVKKGDQDDVACDVSISDIHATFLRKGAWHPSCFRDIVRDMLKAMEDAKRVRVPYDMNRLKYVLETHTRGFEDIANDLRYIDIEDVAFKEKEFATDEHSLHADQKYVQEGSKVTPNAKYCKFRHAVERSPRRNLRFEVITVRNEEKYEILDHGRTAEWPERYARYMLIVLHDVEDIKFMEKIVEASMKKSHVEGGYPRYHPYNFDGDVSVQNFTADMYSEVHAQKQIISRKKKKKTRFPWLFGLDE